MNKQKQKPNYKAWAIDLDSFPHNSTEEDKLKFLLKFGVLAPSVHNTQPWIFVFKGSSLYIKNNISVSLEQADKGDYFQWFAIGMLIENIEQSAKYYGYKIIFDIIEENNIKINLSKNDEPKIYDVQAILDRKSDKRAYNKKDIDSGLLNSLNNLDTPDNVNYFLKTYNDEEYSRIIDLHMKCVENIANDKEFVKELAGWTRSNITKSYDGMPGFVMGMPTLQSLIAPKLLKKKPEIFKKVIPKEKKLIDSASGV